MKFYKGKNLIIFRHSNVWYIGLLICNYAVILLIPNCLDRGLWTNLVPYIRLKVWCRFIWFWKLQCLICLMLIAVTWDISKENIENQSTVKEKMYSTLLSRNFEYDSMKPVSWLLLPIWAMWPIGLLFEFWGDD